jgi:hypothetical protein
LRVAVSRRDFDGAAHRVDDAGELDEKSAAGGFHDPAAVLADLRLAQFAADHAQRSKRALLALADQP